MWYLYIMITVKGGKRRLKHRIQVEVGKKVIRTSCLSTEIHCLLLLYHINHEFD